MTFANTSGILIFLIHKFISTDEVKTCKMHNKIYLSSSLCQFREDLKTRFLLTQKLNEPENIFANKLDK